MSGFDVARIAELPPVHSGDQGVGQAAAFGEAQNEETVLLRVAALSRLPALCPDDALDGAGAWMRIERFDDEQTVLYRPRALTAWDVWATAGSAQALITSLTAYGFGDVRVLHDGDGQLCKGAWYSRFFCFLLPTPLTMPFLLGAALGSSTGNIGPLTAPFLGGPNTTLGSTATPSEVRQVKRQILKFKSINSYPVKVVLVFDGAILCGINAIAPFTCGAYANICRWYLGKVVGENIMSAPFVLGGYFL